MARTRPPWVRRMAGVFSLPVDTASPILPRMPLVWMPVTMPSSMHWASTSLADPREEAATVMSRSPSSRMTCITWLTM